MCVCNDVDKYDFNEGFIEVLEKPEFVHLYFDIDKVKDEDELRSIIASLERYATVFGRYVTGGYTNNKHISNAYNLRYIPNENHFVSMHVIYPDTCISAGDLMNIMKKSYKDFETKSFVDHPCNGVCFANETNTVNEAFDKSVYKLNSRQLFRHVLSDKIYIHGSRVDDKHGDISPNSNPSDHIIHVRGNELLIDESMWREVFTIHTSQSSQTNSQTNRESNIITCSSQADDSQNALTCSASRNALTSNDILYKI